MILLLACVGIEVYDDLSPEGGYEFIRFGIGNNVRKDQVVKCSHKGILIVLEKCLEYSSKEVWI